MSIYVYIISDPRTGLYFSKEYSMNHRPFYIGKGRKSRIKGSKNKDVEQLREQIIKDGFEPKFTIFECTSEKEAFDLEEFYTRQFELSKNGGCLLNKRYGGYGGKLGQVISEEFKELMRIKYIGSGNPFYGKKHSSENIEKNRLAHLGKKLSEEHKSSIGNSLKKSYENGLRKSMKGFKHEKIECPFCNKIAGKNAIKRYHLDNCKEKPA